MDHSFDAAIEADVTPGPDQLLPGAVLAAAGTTREGDFIKAYGRQLPSASSPALDEDAVFWLASCTKLVTTISALQCVERGLFDLDSPDDVERFWPAVKTKEILESFDDATSQAKTRAIAKRMTLRQLLTHSSGLAYDFWPPLDRWSKANGIEAGVLIKSFGDYTAPPLLFEPGESWEYGPGVDVAGYMVERATGTDLETYMQKNIFAPLGMHATCFDIDKRPDLKAKLTPLSVRITNESPIQSTAEANYTKAGRRDWASGGAGLHSTARDVLTLLKALLSNDGSILKQASVDAMFTPQLPDATPFEAKCNHALLRHVFAPGIPPHTHSWNFGLGGKLLMSDVPARFRSGMLSWGGAPNERWWVDRKAGVCGFVGASMLPTHDAKCKPLGDRFEAAAWAQFGATA